MQGDLTTLARVKEWLSGQTPMSSGSDSLLTRLITSASHFVLIYLQRQLAVAAYDEWYDSGGANFLSLRQHPVRTVTSVQFGGFDITTEATGFPIGNGWLLQPPTRLELKGYYFPRGRNVVRVQYQAGYDVQSIIGGLDSQMIPISSPYQITAALAWLGDLSVTIDGVALTPVASAPGPMQYSVAAGVYTFNSAQAGQTASLDYSCIPPDIEQCVIELVGERFKQKSRIGMNSQSLAQGETVNYLVKDMSESIRSTLDRYKNVGTW